MIKIDRDIVVFLKNLDNFVLGLSGGPDSMAAAHFLFHKIRLKNFTCVHINHNFNENSDKWEKLCKEFCLENSIPFFSTGVNIDLTGNKNFENEARKKRYEKLSLFSRHIVTAHHADDFIENLFFGIIRKKGLYNWKLNKIKEFSNYMIIRPFLNISKKDLVLYCEKNNIPYINDPSNKDMKYDRNFLRQVVSLLTKRFKVLEKKEDLIDIITINQKCCEDLAEIDISEAFVFNQNVLSINVSYFKGKNYRLVNALTVFSHKENVHIDKNIIRFFSKRKRNIPEKLHFHMKNNRLDFLPQHRILKS